MKSVFKSIMCAFNQHKYGLRFRTRAPAIGKEETYCVHCGISGELTGYARDGYKG